MLAWRSSLALEFLERIDARAGTDAISVHECLGLATEIEEMVPSRSQLAMYLAPSSTCKCSRRERACAFRKTQRDRALCPRTEQHLSANNLLCGDLEQIPIQHHEGPQPAMPTVMEPVSFSAN